MRKVELLIAAGLTLLSGCSSSQKAEAEKPKAAAPVPPKKTVLDERRLFPRANQVSDEVVQEHLRGKEYLPGGNIAHYKKGKQEYDLFFIRSWDAQSAALLLLRCKNNLDNPKVVPHFGGFFGKDQGVPVFVFAKDVFLAGVAGLPEAQADTVSRDFAARLR